MGSLPYALQLYTVRDHLDRDLAGTLKQVKAMGYDYVELAGLAGRTAREWRELLDELGLAAVSSHVGYAEVTGDVDAAVTDANLLGLKYIVVPYLGADMAPDKAAWLTCARKLDAAGAKIREAGLQLCYHNHAHEFERYDGEYIFDLLYRETKPEHLAAEIDTYWVQYGGADPVATIRRYAGRCPLLHIKDMTAEEPRTFAEVGKGIMDWPAIFAAGKEAGAEWYIVEQDTCAGDSLESARISAEFMARQ